jgi:hypothetical protein
MEKWNINRTFYKVSDFLTWQRNGLLELSPSFQRRPVWSASAKSFLIDTIARGLPIPIIFIREQTDPNTYEPKRQIVDGQQRIRTVLSYIDPKCLKDFKLGIDDFQVKKAHNPELCNKKFEELPKEIKQRILDFSFSVDVLPSNVDDKQVLQIFARMNATGVKLNAQELRNADYSGEFKKVLYDLSYEQLDRWRKWHIFTEQQIARMQEVEMSSDFVLFMFKGLTTKSKSSLDNLYRDKDREGHFQERQFVEDRFHNVMDSIDDKLGDDLKNLVFHKGTLFYYVFALVYDFHYKLGSRLVRAKKRALPNNLVNVIRSVDPTRDRSLSPKVREAATRRTSTEIRETIFQFLKRKCINE